jgi:prevent-host-death family protein
VPFAPAQEWLYPCRMKVGPRALKNRLGECLERVKGGEVVYVTDRGKVVAEIRPAEAAEHDEKAEEEILRRMEAEGLITMGTGCHEDFEPFPVLREGKSASQMVIEDRG